MITRRNLLGILTAPAVIRVAKLMPIVQATPMIIGVDLANESDFTFAHITINRITREAVRQFTNSNAFMKSIDMQYDDVFRVDNAKIGSKFLIRLPHDCRKGLVL